MDNNNPTFKSGIAKKRNLQQIKLLNLYQISNRWSIADNNHQAVKYIFTIADMQKSAKQFRVYTTLLLKQRYTNLILLYA